MAASATIATIVAPPPPADAVEPNWTSSRNSNSSDTANNMRVLYGRHFPVLGNVAVGGDLSGNPLQYNGDPYKSTGGSSFCSINPDNPREYINNACDRTKGAHRGEDIYSPGSHNSPGTFPVVAMYSGTVVKANCAGGAGWQVQIRGADGNFYHYVHLHKRPEVSQDQKVDSGQLIGYLGNTDSGNSNNCWSRYGATHLHLEIRYKGNDSEDNIMDPYPTLREAYAWVGREKNGNIESSFITALVDANQYYSSLTDKLLNVGWTGGGSSLSNVKNTFSSRWNVGGKYQWLHAGSEKWSTDKKSGVIAKRNGLQAFVVPRTVFVEYKRHSYWWGWLGFPTTHFRPGIQYFQGGCIFHDGSRFVAGNYSLNACKRPYQ